MRPTSVAQLAQLAVPASQAVPITLWSPIYTSNIAVLHLPQHVHPVSQRPWKQQETAAAHHQKCVGAFLYRVCLSQGFYSCTNIRTKTQVGEERIYLAYTSTLLFITKEVRTGTQAGQEAGADAEAMEGCYLLACFPWLAQPAFL